MNVSDQNDPPEWNPFQNEPFQNKSNRKGKGRKKIDIAKIENENNLQVTFSKRRAGLFKKASELSILTGAEIAVLVFSPRGIAHSFANPNMETVANKYLTRNQHQNQPRHETNPYIIAQRNSTLLENNQELIELENLLVHEKKRAKENEKITKEILKQGNWSSTRILELRDNEISDFRTNFLNFKVSFDERVENHRASLMNPNLNQDQYSDPNQIPYPNFYIPGQLNPGTATEGFNFSWQNPNGTNYFGLNNYNYNNPGSSVLSFYENQGGSMFLGGLDQSSLFDNMNGNFLNGTNFMDMPGPSGINLTDITGHSGTNVMDKPGSSETNIMDSVSDPMWEQFSAFSFQGNPSSSNTITLPINPNIDNVVPYAMQPGNYMVPLMQGNLENMFQRFNSNYNEYENFMALNQGNIQNMFQGFNNMNNRNYTLSNQGNVHNMFAGTFNNNNENRNFTMPGQENVQNMFQGLSNNNNINNNNNNNINNNNNVYGNSAAPGQISEFQISFQALNRNNGPEN